MNDWKFDDLGKPGSVERNHGLTLRNVSHKEHWFANEIGVAAIWINPNEEDHSQHGPFVLAEDAFSLVGDVREMPEAKTRAPAPFDGYEIERAIRQVYTLNVIPNDPVLGNELFPLAIEQSYRFSAYGKDPPHEPTGQLPAARIFPYVRFDTFNPKIKSIRIDYLMNIVFTPPVSMRPDQSIYAIKLIDAPKTQAGVFRDKDDLTLDKKQIAEIIVGSVVVPIVVPEMVARNLFAAAEKPVPYEILGQGLLAGVPGQHTWDNIHVWPKGEELPSTPGAFHAGHMHWRWARVATHPSRTETVIQKLAGVKAPGQKQFRGNFRGGPLVDPKIPEQTIRFAIAKRGAAELTKMESFEAFFKSRDPQEIRAGEDLDIWFSIEVKRRSSDDAVFGGTTLIHGLYFAHESESKDNPFRFTIGMSLGKQKREKWEWERNPPDE
jgi:hypothetical protein